MGYAINSNMKKFAQSAPTVGKPKESGSSAKASVSHNMKTQSRSTVNKSYTLNTYSGVAARRSGISSYNFGGRSFAGMRAQNIGIGPDPYMYQPMQTTQTTEVKKNFWETAAEIATSILPIFTGTSSAVSEIAGAIGSLSGGSGSSSSSSSASASSSSAQSAIRGMESGETSADVAAGISEAETEISNLESQNSGKTESALESAVQGKKQAVDRKKGEKAQHTSSRQEKLQTVRGCDAKIKALQAQVATLQASNVDGKNSAQISQLQAQIQEQKNAKTRAQQQADELETQINQDDADIASLGEEVTQAQAELDQFKSNDRDIKQLKSSVRSGKSRQGKLKKSEAKEKQKLEREISNIQSEMARLSDKITPGDGMSKKESRNADKIEQLNNQLNEKLARLHELESIPAS